MSSFVCRTIDILTGRRVVILNWKDGEKLDIRAHDRVKIRQNERAITAIVDTTKTIVQAGELGVTRDIVQELDVKDGDRVTLSVLPPPTSIEFIRKKMRGESLTRDEIYSIIQDAVDNSLSDVEMAAFLMAEEYKGMTDEELIWLTRAIAETGTGIDFGRPVYDKHSVGGVPGNKVSLVIIPIAAAAGLLVPKTSSRAITSPSGTADTMSVLAPVDFSAAELRRIALKTGGAIVWGGSLNLAPADDILINVEHPLQIDPECQMMASILAKKLAVGTSYLVLDLPVGKEAKISSFEEGRRLSYRFIELGEKLGMKVKCGITYGGQPVGYAVGPCLEAREALQALEGKGPTSLVEKSTALAGLLLELAGKVVRGKGQELAKEVLESGKALAKMKEIVEAQGGNPLVKSEDIVAGPHKASIEAPCDGYVTRVSNSAINRIARAAGAPSERGAGILFFGKEGHKVGRGQKILEIYAERESRLDEAYNLALKLMPITIEGMLLQEIPEY